LHRTPGPELEAFLNKYYSPDTPFYITLHKLVLEGLKEKWIAAVEVNGDRYRRSRLCGPCEATHYFSITAVWMDSGYRHETPPSSGKGKLKDISEKTELSGQFHIHPYGEINAVITFDDTAEMRGIHSWQGAGWTSPGPGTRHYPTVRGGRVLALFFLPAGRIAYPSTAPPRGPGGLVDAQTSDLEALVIPPESVRLN